MARKPPDWHQPTLFPDPDNNTEPQDQVHPETNGDQHAVQDHCSRTPATTTTDTRPAPEGAEAAEDSGNVREGTKDQARSLEGSTRPADAGHRPEPDRIRGAGDGSQGSGGSFARRI